MLKQVAPFADKYKIIVAGHNEDYTLQTNIDNSANRAYRIFRGAGFTKDQIRNVKDRMKGWTELLAKTGH